MCEHDSTASVARKKICNTCNASLPLSSFHQNKTYADGFMSKCKKCRSIQGAAYYAANAEALSRKSKERYRANPDACLPAIAKWRKANLEKVLRASTKYRTSERGIAAAVASQARRDPIELRDARATTAKKYRLANLDLFRGHGRNRRALLRGAAGSHTKEEVASIIARQAWKCVYCQCNLTAGYDMDHVIPLALGGGNDAGNLQALCSSCNGKKGMKHPLVFALQIGLTIDLMAVGSAPAAPLT